MWLSAPSLSQLIGSGDVSSPCISRWSWSSHFASCEPSEQVMYSALRVDIAMRSFFRDCHETAPVLRMNPSPHRDLRSALSLAQSESVYPVSWLVQLLLLKCSRKLAVDLRYWRTLLAAVRWLVRGQELYRQSAATANEISGRVASAAYINEPTIAW